MNIQKAVRKEKPKAHKKFMDNRAMLLRNIIRRKWALQIKLDFDQREFMGREFVGNVYQNELIYPLNYEFFKSYLRE